MGSDIVNTALCKQFFRAHLGPGARKAVEEPAAFGAIGLEQTVFHDTNNHLIRHLQVIRFGSQKIIRNAPEDRVFFLFTYTYLSYYKLI